MNSARYGLGYGGIVWRGSGLYTQLVALILMTPSLGLAARTVETGKHRLAASVGIALTSLSHIVFGYAIFASIGVWALAGPRAERGRRLARLVSVSVLALVLIAWFVVPMLLVAQEMNRSRWEAAFKFDSFGAPTILAELFSGRLFDSGRLPVFSLILAAATALAVTSIREALPRRLLTLAVFWLVLFFGKATWGHLLIPLGIPSAFPMHRFQAAFELSAVLLAAWGLDRMTRWAVRNQGATALLTGAVLGAAFWIMGTERARYLQENSAMGFANLKAYEGERANLDAALADIRRVLAERPGRTFAGLAASWGNQFRLGSATLYSFLTREHMDEASFLYHSMSLTSDVMVLRGQDPADDRLFGIRAVLAPVNVKPAPHWRLRGSHGRFNVYEASPEGYFSLVDVGASYDGPLATAFDPNSGWLKSPMMQAGVVVTLDRSLPEIPSLRRWQGFPASDPAFMRPRGVIVSEQHVGENYSAHAVTARACYALIKITWFPDLVATVDGKLTPILRVTPGFGAIALSAGDHQIEVHYAPGPLKPVLFLAGILLVALAVSRVGAPALQTGEERLAGALEAAGGRLATPRAVAACGVALLILLSTHALFRGQLIDGHDATTYPPRVTEFSHALLNGGQLPPIWAPDLSNGHGQPFFEFAPPLLHAVALPLWKLGFGLADSLQLALAILVALGGIAMYRLARMYRSARFVAIAVTGAWLFAPYLALDLYVRAAFAEAAALAIAPLALLGLERALEKPSPRRLATGAVAIALIPLAHNAIALLLFPVFGVLVLAEALVARRPLRTAGAGASVMAAGLGLSAFFWIPALLEKDFVKTDLERLGSFHWSIHAISPHQLLWGRWGFGYSVAGPNDGISFAPGLVMLLLAAIGAVLAIKSADPRRRARAVVFVAAAAVAAWLATEDSAVAWSRVVMLQYFQFPWRALSVVALMLPLLALPALERIGPRGALAMLALIVFVNLHHTEPKGYLTFDEEFYYPESIAGKDLNTATRPEFEPPWFEPRWAAVRPSYSPQKLRARSGQMSVLALRLTPSEQVFDASAQTVTPVEALTFYYPGWTVLVDDREVPVSPCPASGTMCFELPPGQHRVALQLRATPTRRAAKIISLLSAILLLLAVVAGGMAAGMRRRPG